MKASIKKRDFYSLIVQYTVTKPTPLLFIDVTAPTPVTSR